MEQAANQASGNSNVLATGVTTRGYNQKKTVRRIFVDYLDYHGHFNNSGWNIFPLPVSATRRTPVSRSSIADMGTDAATRCPGGTQIEF